MICFDTDVLSVFLRQGASPATQRRLASVAGERQFTTAVNLAELLYGAERIGNASLAARIDELVAAALTVLPFDEAAARVYARLRAILERSGRPLAEPDLRIGAIVLSRELTLVTGNDRHFSRIPGLAVENWLRD